MLDTSRNSQIEAFLAAQLGAGYQHCILAADASFRRYLRVHCAKGTPCVLMDAPPPKEDVRPFSAITHWLREAGLHAPKLLAEDAEQGFLLLEDFGDDSFRKHIDTNRSEEWPLYRAAIDVLLHLRQSAKRAPSLAAYDEATYLRELEVFTDWYLPSIGKEALKAEFLALWQPLLARSGLEQTRLVLRDYHADNLMWLADENGTNRVGLLDYQDALIGDSAYDMVSLLEDARRDVSPEVAQKALAYYLEQSGEDEASFMARYALLGAQRNLKIIGIFNRLNARDGKAHYLPLLPRVWTHLHHDLAHPALASVKAWLETQLDTATAIQTMP